MLISSVPYKFSHVWSDGAGGGYITNPIPVTAAGGAASQTLGFPPVTATAVGAGGIPPNISDFNGALSYLSAWAQWQQAVGIVPYDATFQAAIGGYPKTALILSVARPGVVWQSLADNNTSNPESGGANWAQYPPHGQAVFAANGTWTAPDGVTRVYAELWGGGGGGLGGTGASGAGGGYAADWITVTPGGTLSVVCGGGGVATGAAPGGTGGTSAFGGLIAYGGTGGGAGPGPGGSGTGASLIIGGQGGTDLTDSGSYVLGTVGNAIGGDAPRGGLGGNVNAGGTPIGPTAPGGGGGANAANNGWCQSGANGWVKLSW